MSEMSVPRTSSNLQFRDCPKFPLIAIHEIGVAITEHYLQNEGLKPRFKIVFCDHVSRCFGDAEACSGRQV